MSASTEKKNRVAARAAGTDRKTMAAAEAARKKKESNRNWAIGIAATVLVIALIILFNSNFLYTSTTAVKIGGENYSPAQVSYYYGNQYMTFLNSYGNYASLFGLDTSKGLAGLDSQECTMMEEGSTWKDYFLESAYSEMKQYAALNKYAADNGIELTAEEIAGVDSGLEQLKNSVSAYGFTSLDNYFSYNFGKGVTEKVAREEMIRSTLAAKAYNAYADSLEYSDSELKDYYAGLDGEADVFDYAYYAVFAEKVAATDAEGNETQEVNDETVAAAKEKADAILAAYQADTENVDAVAKLDAAIASAGEEGTATHSSAVAGSSLSSTYKDWMKAARTEGDATVAVNADSSTFYVVVFLGRDDNDYSTVNVRHILVKAEADENGEYTDEAKQAALAKAEMLYDQWKSGDATEDSFAELANLNSEDTGSNTNGGLYEDVHKNEMVTEFNDFCFADGRKVGDSGIVYGESDSYAGYHVMYISGFGENYRDIVARDGLNSEALNAWMEELLAGFDAETCRAVRHVGKI